MAAVLARRHQKPGSVTTEGDRVVPGTVVAVVELATAVALAAAVAQVATAVAQVATVAELATEAELAAAVALVATAVALAAVQVTASSKPSFTPPGDWFLILQTVCLTRSNLQQ